MRSWTRAAIVAVVLSSALGAILLPASDDPRAATFATFERDNSLTTVSNPSPQEVTVYPDEQRAVWDHCCTGGGWKVAYDWTVPTILLTDDQAEVELGMQVSNVNPEQRLYFQMSMLAPDKTDALGFTYPDKSADKKVVQFPISASYESSDTLTITIREVGGAEITYVYKRAAPACPGSGANASAEEKCPEVKSIPAPAGFDTTISRPAPAPGDAAATKSPPLGDAKTVTATVQGLSAEDAVVLAGLKKACYSNFVRALTPPKEAKIRIIKDRIESYYEQPEVDVPKALSDLTFCLAFAEALVIEAANSSTNGSDPGAAGARARCRGAGVKYTLEGTGRNTKVKSLRLTSGKLRVSCKRVRNGLKIKYSTESGGPLRRAVGKRLRLVVMRSEDDPPGGKLSFRYHKG